MAEATCEDFAWSDNDEDFLEVINENEISKAVKSNVDTKLSGKCSLRKGRIV